MNRREAGIMAIHGIMAAYLGWQNPARPRIQWLVFKMQGCVPCAVAENNMRTRLESVGWSIGEQASAQIRLVPLETQQELVNHHGVKTFPQFLLMVDGECVERHYRFPGSVRLAVSFNEEVARLK